MPDLNQAMLIKTKIFKGFTSFVFLFLSYVEEGVLYVKLSEKTALSL